MAQYNPRFTLKSSNSDKKEIVLRIYYNNHTFAWDLKDFNGRVLKIHPELWDKIHQKPVSKSNILLKNNNFKPKELQIIKETIDKVKSLVNDIINTASQNKIKINNEYLRKEIEENLGLKEKKKEITVYQFLLNTIVEMENGTLLIKSTKVYEPKTIDKYKNSARILEVFKPKSTFAQIDEEWYNSYILFLTHSQSISFVDQNGTNKEFVKNDLSPGSIGNEIKNLGKLMRLAVKKKISNNRAYDEEWFMRPINKKSKNHKTDLALNESEIRQIFDFEVNKYGLNLAKDLFLIGCYTGLRASDFNTNLSQIDFIDIQLNENEVVKILVRTLKKTKETIYIPLLWDEVMEIFKSRNFKMDYLVDQTVNNYIKKILENISYFDVEYQWNEIRGGKNILFKEKKWKLISNHTARRSFTSNLSRRGFSDDEISYFTGHSVNSMVSRYIKLSGEERAVLFYEKFKKSKIIYEK